jgi:hypothetical protein
MKRPSSHIPPQRVQHPALETFERVMNNGIVVDCRSGERSTAADVSEAGVNLLSVESDISTYPIRRVLFQSLREFPLDDTAYEGWQTAREAGQGPRRLDRSRK